MKITGPHRSIEAIRKNRLFALTVRFYRYMCETNDPELFAVKKEYNAAEPDAFIARLEEVYKPFPRRKRKLVFCRLPRYFAAFWRIGFHNI